MESDGEEDTDTICTREDVFRKAKELYEGTLVKELLEHKRGKYTIKQRREELYNECMRLNSVFKTTDEENMMRFACSLFSSPDTMIGITQHWQRMAGHTIAPKEYQGEGRVWTTLLHILLCDARLSVEMVSMFQTYEMKVYLYGIESCPLLEILYERGAFQGTCFDEKVVPEEKRVTSPSFLRFDPGYLPTLSGRGCLCILRGRNAFVHNQYRTGSNCCTIQSTLRDELAFIYESIFDYFRPCVLACMLVSFAWAAYRTESPFFKARFSQYVASLLVHIDDTLIPMMDTNEEFEETTQYSGEEVYNEKILSRLRILRTVLECFLEQKDSKGYTKETLKELYTYMWKHIIY